MLNRESPGFSRGEYQFPRSIAVHDPAHDRSVLYLDSLDPDRHFLAGDGTTEELWVQVAMGIVDSREWEDEGEDDRDEAPDRAGHTPDDLPDNLPDNLPDAGLMGGLDVSPDRI